MLACRARKAKEDPARLSERLGRAGLSRPGGPLVWVHGASVGEGLSTLPLIEALLAARANLQVLVTTGTVTSAALLTQRLVGEEFEGRVRHQYVPVDAPGAVSRFLRSWQPDLAVFTEGDIWPNLLMGLQRAAIPAALVSARMTAASTGGWARWPKAARCLFGGLALVLSQDDDIADRLKALGSRDDGRLNLKLAGQAPPVTTQALETARGWLGARPLLLAASTHAGEDEPVMGAFAGLPATTPPTLLVVVPRHPERGAEVEALARRLGLSSERRSTGADGGDVSLYVADTLGEMGLWYRLACGTFLGGSLVAGPGGHNPVEPARLAVPIATGPFLHNWQPLFDALRRAGGLMDIQSTDDLAVAFEQMRSGAAAPIGAAAEQALPRQEDLSAVAHRLLGLMRR